jgi:deoxycytidine triphosphate deaminase
MARILPDYEIKRLIGTCIEGADREHVHPNGIELRLGKSVYFYFSNKKEELGEGKFLTVRPGEQVLFTIHEKIDFTQKKVDLLFPPQELDEGKVSRKQLMAFLTPRTSEIRDGSFQATTKVDSGFRGRLVWSMRNSSNDELNIEFGQPILKMTVFLLEGDEVPEDLSNVNFMDEDDIAFSQNKQNRIPENQKVRSDYKDDEAFLQSMGGPFRDLSNMFSSIKEEVTSIKNDVDRKIDNLGAKIDKNEAVLEANLSTKFSDLGSKIDRFHAEMDKRVCRMEDALNFRLGDSLDLKIILRFVLLLSGMVAFIKCFDVLKGFLGLGDEVIDAGLLIFSLLTFSFTLFYLRTKARGKVLKPLEDTINKSPLPGEQKNHNDLD